MESLTTRHLNLNDEDFKDSLIKISNLLKTVFGFPNVWDEHRYALLTAQRGGILVAERNESLIGCAIYQNIHDHDYKGPIFFISYLAVVDIAVNQEVPTVLGDALTPYIINSGANYVRVEVQQDNVESINLYKSRGFIHIKTINNFVVLEISDVLEKLHL